MEVPAKGCPRWERSPVPRKSPARNSLFRTSCILFASPKDKCRRSGPSKSAMPSYPTFMLSFNLPPRKRSSRCLRPQIQRTASAFTRHSVATNVTASRGKARCKRAARVSALRKFRIPVLSPTSGNPQARCHPTLRRQSRMLNWRTSTPFCGLVRKPRHPRASHFYMSSFFLTESEREHEWTFSLQEWEELVTSGPYRIRPAAHREFHFLAGPRRRWRNTGKQPGSWPGTGPERISSSAS